MKETAALGIYKLPDAPGTGWAACTLWPEEDCVGAVEPPPVHQNTHQHHPVMFSNSVLLTNSLTVYYYYYYYNINAAQQLLLMKEAFMKKGMSSPLSCLP